MPAESCLKTTLTIFLLFLLTCNFATVHAKTIHVDNNDPADFSNIQAAIDNANDGDIIIVNPGTYTGDGNRDIDFKGKAITVRSTNPNDPNIVAATVIDCNGTEEEPHRGFYFQNGEDKNSILSGVAIVNGLLYRRYPEGGGGILCQDASPTISNCVISKNWGSTGGGICILGDNASPTILNCIIKDNGASFGGGLSCHQSSPAIINCIITNNVGANDCGGIDCDSASTRVINTIITGNFAWDGDVGAICAYYHSNIMLSNCTIVGNSSYTEVGVVSINRDSSATITNCIIWGNDGEQIREEATVCYTDVEGGYKGQGNINAGPKFVDTGHWTCHPFNGGTWVDGDYHLLPGSPCIDAGNPNYIAEPNETDLDGRPRIIGCRIDMGAYEFLSQMILYVDTDATGANDGSSWADAFNYLQDALTKAYYGDEIRVAQGIYKPDQGAGIAPGDRTATFQLINGVTIKGGYAGIGTPDPDARHINLYETILSGDLNGDDGPNFSNNEENSYHVVTGSGTYQTAILDGFTITAGKANGSWLLYQDDGGGLCNYAGSPTIGNCTFTGNWAGWYGGGIYNESSSPTLFNCTIRYNVARGSGSGMCNREGSNPIVTNCTFSFNVGLSYHDSLGVGMYNYKSNPILSNCAFTGNSGSFGAGMCNYYSDPKLTSCTFIANKVHAGGGGMANLESSPTLINCTFSGNWSDWYGVGGMDNCCGSTPILTNCILWNDMPGEISGPAVITYSNVQGGWPGTGNIDAEPSFVSPGYWDTNDTPDKPWDDFWIDGDYHLLPGSPCIDTGDPNYIAGPNETDLDGKPRVIGGRIDMGAYEYRFTISAEVRILPRTINLASKGNWITANIWLPDRYDVADIEPNSIFLQNEIKPEQFLVDQQQQVATVIFSREDVLPILEVGDISLKITGQLSKTTYFEATDKIKVIDKAVKN